MSLRTGGQIATVVGTIINPNNLKIEGLYCHDSLDKKQTLVLLYQDIRDVIAQGVVVNDHDVLSEPDELVRLKDTMKLNFELLGKQVVTDKKRKLGKVNDYAFDSTTMFIQKLYVSQSLLKNFSTGGISVERGQIIEITNRKIVVQDPLQGVPATAASAV
ncbi:MAG TPA: hypothetical protein VLE69_00890 [Candidatus Saccharimonadales bacterium]|nr:hypothetical protein [Candidatus Saccharimonadales bacterium]